MDIHDSVELIYEKIRAICFKQNNLTSHHNLSDPRILIALLIEENIITEEVISRLHKEYVLSRRDERSKIIKQWIDEDRVILELIRK